MNTFALNSVYPYNAVKRKGIIMASNPNPTTASTSTSVQSTLSASSSKDRGGVLPPQLSSKSQSEKETAMFLEALGLAVDKNNLAALKTMLATPSGKKLDLGNLTALKERAEKKEHTSTSDYLTLIVRQKRIDMSSIKEKYLILNVKNEAYLKTVFESLSNLNKLPNEQKNMLSEQGVNLDTLSELAFRIGERQKVDLPTFIRNQNKAK